MHSAGTPRACCRRSSRAPAARSGFPTRASCRRPAPTASGSRRSRRAGWPADRRARIWPRLGSGHRAFDHPLELADVARPVVGHERVDRGRRHRVAPATVVPREKVLRQLEDVVLAATAAAAPAPPRRSTGRTGRRGTAPSTTSAARRPVRRRDDAHVDARPPVPPTRSTVRSWMARSSFACADSDRSDTSSRNSVPPSACSNLPRRPRTPVAVRSSMPNSSASISVSTSAAQLMATNGPCRRRLQRVDLPRHQLLAHTALALDEDR